MLFYLLWFCGGCYGPRCCRQPKNSVAGEERLTRRAQLRAVNTSKKYFLEGPLLFINEKKWGWHSGVKGGRSTPLSIKKFFLGHSPYWEQENENSSYSRFRKLHAPTNWYIKTEKKIKKYWEILDGIRKKPPSLLDESGSYDSVHGSKRSRHPTNV